MKKYAVLFFILLAFPIVSSAQTVNPNASLIATLTALVQVLENEIQAILAQQTAQTQVLQQIVQNQAPAPVVTPTVASAPTIQATTTPPTPPQYPTPEVFDVVNDNATFSPDNAQNGFTIGTFNIAYSGPWSVQFVVTPNGIGTPITQTQANDGDDCIGYGCTMGGSDLEKMMVGLDYLPSPGTYTMKENAYINNQLVSGSPMLFTFTVATSTNQ